MSWNELDLIDPAIGINFHHSTPVQSEKPAPLLLQREKGKQTMRANFHCLSHDRAWQRRYFFAWIALALYGCLAFALGNRGAFAIAAQGLFFIAAFAAILWPVCAAFQADCDWYGRPKRKSRP